MEFVNGRDLASHVERGGPFSVAEAVDCTRQAGLGLAYAHSQGIVHRDIKPANLIRDLSGMIKVADLGLARLNTPDVNASITQAGGVLGTMDYMPPEQALDSTDIDHRADIYSLGYTLYFLIQGRTPYTGGSIMALLLKHRDAPIPALGEGRLDVPPELEAIYRRMVAKKPDDRFPTMAEAVQALADLESRIRFDQKPPAVMNLPPTTASAGTTTEFLSPGSPGWDSTIVVSNSPINQPSSDGATRLDGLVVVLVEPSRTQAGIISRYLTSQGAKTVLQTGNGHDAIALALKERADVVISSMHLSDMTGATLSSKILADPLCDHLGVVLATSAADLEQSNQFPVSKRFVVLPKPFDARQLALRVTSVAKQK
jgi:serine/threonine protein kinase